MTDRNTGRILLRTTSSTAAVDEKQTPEAASPFTIPANPADVSPASFQLRRVSLGLSTDELGTLLGVSREQIDLIESTYLSDDVDFLHNLALSLLEMSRSGRRSLHEA